MPQFLAKILMHTVFGTQNRVSVFTEPLRRELYGYLAGILKQCRSPVIRYRRMMSDMFGIEVFAFGVRGYAVRPNCCAPMGLGSGWRIRIPGRCPGLVCSGPSDHGEVITPPAGMSVTFLRTALQNRVTALLMPQTTDTDLCEAVLRFLARSWTQAGKHQIQE